MGIQTIQTILSPSVPKAIIQLNEAIQELQFYLENLELWNSNNFAMTVNGVLITLTPQQQTDLQNHYQTLKDNLSTLFAALP